MKRIIRWTALLVCLLLCAAPVLAGGRAFTGYSIKSSATYELAEGVTYERYHLIPPDRNVHRGQRIYLLDIRPGAHVRLVASPSGERIHKGLATLTSILDYEKERTGATILGGVNGDFFDTAAGGPVGYLKREGEWLVGGEFPESWACGMTCGGQPVIGQPRLKMTLTLPDGSQYAVNALNGLRADLTRGESAPSNAKTAREDNRLVLFTPAFGTKTATQAGGTEVRLRADGPLTDGKPLTAAVEEVTVQRDKGGMALEAGMMVLSAVGEQAAALKTLRPGDRVTLALTVDDAFSEVDNAVGGGRPDGGPLLLWDGRPTDLEAARAASDDIQYFYRHHARTAMGIRADGSYFLLVIEGNRTGSYGMTLEEAQTLLLDLGAYSAMNLDGGPSSTMAILLDGKMKLVSDTTGGQGRQSTIGSALYLVAEE